MDELNINFDLNFKDFNIDINLDQFKTFNNRHIKPPICKEIKESRVSYESAQKLAKNIDLSENTRTFCTINGNFIFGDFIEALIVDNELIIKSMTISTLSMSENNVDSLANLLNWEFVKELNLIVSDYFFSHERGALIPYIYQELDKEDKFQLAVCRTHCKLCIFQTNEGKKYVIHGSANLRSSGNIEQFMFEENKYLYDFNFDYQKKIIDIYKTINKPLNAKTLWQAVQEHTKE